MDSDLAQALVTAAIWLGVVSSCASALNAAFARYERRLAERDPTVAARRRTTYRFLLRVVVALAALIGTWSVLSIFAATQEIARAFLASSAVLALIAGLALTTPLGNLGSGVLLAFTQPIRLGDRITVGEHTGVVDDITLSYTRLATDEGRQIFVPNTQMVSTTLVNRSVADPRRLVTVQLPVRLGVPLDEARRVTADAAAKAAGGDVLEVDVQVGEVAERTVWLSVVAYAPFAADVSRVASDIREGAVTALAEAGLLPGRLELGELARTEDSNRYVGRDLADGGDELGGGRSRNAGRPRSPRCSGKYVPQWIGIATFGAMRRTASARAVGSRCPPFPRVGPQPQIGMSPTSTSPSSSIPSKRSVSPAKYTEREPEIT